MTRLLPDFCRRALSYTLVAGLLGVFATLLASAPASAQIGASALLAGESASGFLTPDGWLNLEALHEAGYEGSLDPFGSDMRIDPETGHPSFPNTQAGAPTHDDKNWWGGFHPPGVDGGVSAIAFYEGSLVVGGRFSYAGTTAVNNIARWDGADWIPLGSGTSDRVKSLAVYDGKLIVGGEFTEAGGLATGCIASWDGSSWAPLGSGIGAPAWGDPSVEVLTIDDGSLIVGGAFTTAGGDTAKNIASWDGSSWSPLGSGLPSGVLALTVYGGSLVAGGRWSRDIDDTSQIHETFLLRWNGDSWDSVGTGLSPDTPIVSVEVAALTVYQGDLIAGGRFKIASGAAVNGIARWDGSAWQPLGTGVSWRVMALTAYEDDLVAGGTFVEAGGDTVNNIARWDGASWMPLGTGIEPGAWFPVRCTIVHDGNLIVGGYFVGAGGIQANGIATWDGLRWAAVGEGYGLSGMVYAVTTYEGDLIAGGTFTLAGGDTAIGIARWDGASWSPVGTGMNGPVTALTIYEDNLVAAWALTEAGTTAANCVGWDGTSWSPLGSGMNDAVLALTVYEGNLIAGGYFTEADGLPADHIASWDGTSWSPLGSGMSAVVLTLTVSDGCLVAGGNFVQAGGIQVSRIAKWDGTSWSPLGSGMNYPVAALTAYGKDLIAGGYFTQAGDVSANLVASWDGVSWSPLGSGLVGSGMNNNVLALTVYGGSLIAAGNFRTAQGDSVDYIARWGGSCWSPMGSGLSGGYLGLTVAFDLTVYDGGLIVGGNLTAAGGKPSSYVARWDDPFPPVTHFEAVAGDNVVDLIWANPSHEAFKGTLIRYSTDTYPDSPTSGKPVPNGNSGFFEGAADSDTSFAHTRLGGGITYYSAFAYDETFTFSPAIRARATPGDHAPSDLLLGILQNPYLTQYLDIYLVSPEPLDSASVTLGVSGASTPIRLLDPSENVWKADFKISLPSDSIELSVCASDLAGNDTCLTAVFSATRLIAEQGGTVSSPDGRVNVKTDPHTLTEDVYVVVLPCKDISEQGHARGLDDLEIAYLTDSGRRPAAYHISPPGILRGTAAYLEFSYDESDLTPGIFPDQLYIEQDGSKPLDCFVDPENQTVSTTVCQLGTFRLASGDRGVSSITDPDFLQVRQNFPNPFGQTTRIRFEVRARQYVSVEVYDVAGRFVASLVEGVVTPGVREVRWDGCSWKRHAVSSGLYFLRVRTDHKTATRKMLLIR